MAATKKIKRALVSVFYKEGLDEILRKLHEEGVSFVSTGGTQSFIESLGIRYPLRRCRGFDGLSFYIGWSR